MEKPVTPPAALPPLFLDVTDFEREAQAKLPAMSWSYLSGGASDELTLRWNRESYDRLRLRPRALVDVSRLDPSITLLGRRHAFPLLLAPAAYQGLTHPEADLATVRGANAADVTMVASTFSSHTVEDIAAQASRPLWLQLYLQRDREFTRDLIRRAEKSGCEALVVTVDTPVLGPRNRELRARFSLPPGVERANLRGFPNAGGAHRSTEGAIYSALLDPSLTWKDIAWLKAQTSLPILLKGILNPDDAVRAAEAGVAGIIVSNHGARNLDTEPATIDALPEVVAKVGGRLPILVDGGVRRGTDILKALALGANAVLIGRPYLYGLAVDGSAGVTRVISILRRELEMAMAVCGRTSIAEIDSTVLWR